MVCCILLLFHSIFVLFRLVDIRRLLLGTILATVICIFYLVIFRHEFLADAANFFSVHMRDYLGTLRSHSITDSLVRTWREYWGILNINQTDSKWDLWHYFLGDRYAYDFLKHAGWNDVYPYLPAGKTFVSFLQEMAMVFYWKSYEIPWVYFAWNPVWMLALYLIVVLGCRWLPLAAIFSSIVIIQVLGLLFIANVLNWRYYYFVDLGAYFLIPMVLLDVKRWKTRKSLQAGR